MRLRNYQQESLSAIKQARQQGKKEALVVMATGLGKTVVSAFAVRDLLAEESGRVLYLCHQNDILRQARREFANILDASYTYGYFHGSEKHLHSVDLLFASFQTMARNREMFKRREFKYIVIDEVHHVQAATYHPTVKYFKPDFKIGLTATPKRHDGLDITELLGQPVFQLDIAEALAKGHLCKVDYRLMTDEIQNLEILDTPAGKLSISELNRTLFIPKRDEEIVRIIEEKTAKIKPHRVMIFCPSIQYVDRLAAMMPHATILHSKIKSNQERQERLDAFRKGKVNTVLTVDMFNEGIDVPEANIIVFLRTTQSKTIFLQQLGRGLRKVEGKRKVLVLDFVANCERIEMIDAFKKDIQHVTNGLSQQDDVVSGSSETIDIDLAGFEFNEVAKRVLDVVGQVKAEYSKEVLVQQLRDYVERTDLVPTITAVKKASKTGEMASVYIFVKYFGSFNRALLEAGLTPNQLFIEYNVESLKSQLMRLSQRTGKQSPTQRDLREYRAELSLSCETIFVQTFGSWYKALKAAGLQPNNHRPTREDLKQQLVRLAEYLGGIPTTTDLITHKKALSLSGKSAFRREFGSWENTVQAAGLVRESRRERLIAELIRLSKKTESRSPKAKWLKKYKTELQLSSLPVFQDEFGDWEGALMAAGLESRKNDYTRDDLIEQLKQLSRKVGNTSPTTSDLQLHRLELRLTHHKLFKDEFGSWNLALEAAGLQPNKWGQKTSREELIQELRRLEQKVGEVPSEADLQKYKQELNLSAHICYLREFSTWRKGLLAAGLLQTRRERLVADLQLLSEALNKRKLTTRDLGRNRKQLGLASQPTFIAEFGSWANALKEAGLVIEEERTK